MYEKIDGIFAKFINMEMIVSNSVTFLGFIMLVFM